MLTIIAATTESVFVVHADEILTAFLELELAIRAGVATHSDSSGEIGSAREISRRRACWPQS
jgi:hypothetical protein